jgi:hypothetical protein
MLNITRPNSFLRLWDGFADQLQSHDVIGALMSLELWEPAAANFYS